MSSSPPSQSAYGHAEASSSRASNGKQPAVEDDHSDEEALLADDPLERDLPEQYAKFTENASKFLTHICIDYRSSANPRPLHPLSACRDSSPRRLEHLAIVAHLFRAHQTPASNSSEPAPM